MKYIILLGFLATAATLTKGDVLFCFRCDDCDDPFDMSSDLYLPCITNEPPTVSTIEDIVTTPITLPSSSTIEIVTTPIEHNTTVDIVTTPATVTAETTTIEIETTPIQYNTTIDIVSTPPTVTDESSTIEIVTTPIHHESTIDIGQTPLPTISTIMDIVTTPIQYNTTMDIITTPIQYNTTIDIVTTPIQDTLPSIVNTPIVETTPSILTTPPVLIDIVTTPIVYNTTSEIVTTPIIINEQPSVRQDDDIPLQQACYLIRRYVGDELRTKRGCTIRNLADDGQVCDALAPNTTVTYCRICTENGCNTASSIYISGFTLISAIILMLLRFTN